ncbi:unnamed protein product [Paramecium primaurelia]|uniref:Uncharacterized protein n=1 Tax=Paramecium primaurelia TaxID=5886 RepID=A0A8S1L1V6_PARPR|nr:unnamed protein product [Paramecium primaurelia]
MHPNYRGYHEYILSLFSNQNLNQGNIILLSTLQQILHLIYQGLMILRLQSIQTWKRYIIMLQFQNSLNMIKVPNWMFDIIGLFFDYCNFHIFPKKKRNRNRNNLYNLAT